MPSSTTENQGPLDRLQNHPVYGTSRADVSLAAWISQPGVLVSVLAISRAASRGQQLPNPAELLWKALVFLTPAFLLYAVDRWVNPPAFPIPMLQPQPTTHAAKSDVLRRILRVDQPGGIVASVSEAGRRAYTNTFSGPKGGSCQPAGLSNWDNSCFQNSVLQGLASLKHLPRYLTGLAPGHAVPSSDTLTTAGALRAFAADLNDVSNNGKTLSTPGVLKNMSTIQQQDAQEYFSRLMDQVDKDIEKGAKAAYRPPGFEPEPSRDDTTTSQHSDDSGYQSLPVLSKAGSELMTIRNPLEGLSAQRVACTVCGYSEGLSMIPFNCLTLNFEVGVEQYDLFELLDNYVQLESIFSVDCVKCTLLEYRRSLQHLAKAIPAAADRLSAVEAMLEDDEFDDESFKKLRIPDAKKVSSTKTKQVAIGRPPRSLVLHMNRSVFDPMTFRSYKNTAAVQFPKTLDLGPWCVGSAGGVNAPTEAKGGGDHEQWVIDATASMVAGDAHPSRISGPIYELRAVVTHYGRHENGHYVCYRRHPVNTSKSTKRSKPQDDAARPPNLVGDGQADDVDSFHEDEQDEAVAAAAEVEDPYSEDTDSQWWRLSDETVTQVSEQDVLLQGGVFMLFYDCTDPNSILVTPGETLETDDAEDGVSAISSVALAAEGAQRRAQDGRSCY
ncbi:cysteine proteinase [Cryphonectria parasitica EP155]|uniref:ubiquitinyl hydrolase 1 n=1 Tax=Cryphonectria parasitica (strain ATCC 38755 / EP155) TaxID=660469 RepID=A0A9P4YC46_CRYP1|nr:cysteine proteinase [Cryphonectria parasitica EP155]KAF3770641.1 cysteine proteinase [Cryphonectria parasitica EP155]